MASNANNTDLRREDGEPEDRFDVTLTESALIMRLFAPVTRS